jgi:hypothetical protein
MDSLICKNNKLFKLKLLKEKIIFFGKILKKIQIINKNINLKLK